MSLASAKKNPPGLIRFAASVAFSGEYQNNQVIMGRIINNLLRGGNALGPFGMRGKPLYRAS